MTAPNALNALAEKLGETALRTVVKVCREDLVTLSTPELEQAADLITRAMKNRVAEVVETFLRDLHEAPWIGEAAFAAAALELAQAGITALRNRLPA